MSGKTPREDLRIRKTKRHLWDSLVRLSVERGFDRITVSDICEDALVNRSTFYRHYEDKSDLLLRRLDETLDDIARSARGVLDVAEDGNAAHLLRFFQLVEGDADFYRTMLGPEGSGAFSDRLRQYMVDSVLARVGQWGAKAHRARVPVELIAHYHASAALGLIKWWVDGGMECSAEQLTEHHYRLVAFSTLENLGVEQPVAAPKTPAN